MISIRSSRPVPGSFARALVPMFAVVAGLALVPPARAGFVWVGNWQVLKNQRWGQSVDLSDNDQGWNSTTQRLTIDSNAAATHDGLGSTGGTLVVQRQFELSTPHGWAQALMYKADGDLGGGGFSGYRHSAYTMIELDGQWLYGGPSSRFVSDGLHRLTLTISAQVANMTGRPDGGASANRTTSFTMSFGPVPEPSAFVSMGVGRVVLGWIGRRGPRRGADRARRSA